MNNDLKTILMSLAVFLCTITSVFAAVDLETKKTVHSVSSDHVANWALGLIAVLCLFFVCVWLLKKIGALPLYSKANIRVIAGLSLGMREKLVLVQVGEKQLVLGVTPGRIDNLLVLEGNEQLFLESSNKKSESDFANKLKQVMSDSE